MVEQEMRVNAKKETAFASAQQPPEPAAEPALMDRLDELESQSVFILREAFARLQRIAILWSLGKDSNVMIWLARKAFFGRVPCPVMHVDTGKKFPEMYAFRDRYAKEWQLDLLVEPCPPIDAVDPKPPVQPRARPKGSSSHWPSTDSTG
jgi:sulfate adenylyltransferase subunit 2